MSSRLRLTVAAVLVASVVALVSVSCTSKDALPDPRDSPKPPPKQYPRTEAGITESLVDHLTAVGPDLGEWAPPHDQATCVAEHLVRRLGADHLLELGFDPQKGSIALAYPPEERTAVINLLIGCVNFEKAYLEVLSSYQKLRLPVAACVSRGFTRLGLPRDLAEGLVDGKEPDPFANNARSSVNLAKLLDECLGKDDMVPGAPLAPLPTATSTSTTTTSTPRSTTTRPATSTTLDASASTAAPSTKPTTGTT